MSDFVPNIFFTTPMVTVFVAGPAERKTNAAPALTPLNISPAAMGKDAVAQTYMGTAMMITSKYASHVLSESSSARLSGMATVMRAPMIRPQNSGFAMSPSRVVKAYFIARRKENGFFSSLELSQQLLSSIPHDSSDIGVSRADIESAPTGYNVENPIVGVDSISTLNGFCFLVTELVEVSLSNILVSIPATIAIIIDVIARYTVNIHPNIPYVAMMESTPVMGVDIRKESVAPLRCSRLFDGSSKWYDPT